jgi:Protein of unknown function (DUF3761)
MTMRRMLFTAAGLLFLSAGSLAAQEMKVTCKDGTLSKGGQGACSSHGGIATKSTVKSESKAAASTAKADANAMKSAAKTDAKMAKSETKSAAKEMKADAKTAAKDAKAEEKDAKGATAQCKDNTYSHAKNRQGMCSGHGGVAKMMGK